MNIFQSTHPSGVRPTVVAYPAVIPAISIHAPQWGATFHCCSFGVMMIISIHAPQWGAT